MMSFFRRSPLRVRSPCRMPVSSVRAFSKPHRSGPRPGSHPKSLIFNDARIRLSCRRASPLEPARARASADDDNDGAIDQQPTAIRVVIPFVFRHWRHQPARALAVAGGAGGDRRRRCSCRCSPAIWSMR